MSIVYKQAVVLFPIVPNKSYNQRSKRFGLFHETKALFEPISLPIEGIYNEIGSIEEIKRDSHTVYLERRFGLDIETIVEIMSCNRDLFHSSGRAWEKLAIIKTAPFKNYDTKESVNTFWLDMGAIVAGDVIRFSENIQIRMEWVSDNQFVLHTLNENNQQKTEPIHLFDVKSELLSVVQELTGYYVNYPPEHHKFLEFVQNVSLMMVDKRIYEGLIEMNKKRHWSIFETRPEDSLTELREAYRVYYEKVAEAEEEFKEDEDSKKLKKTLAEHCLKYHPYSYSVKSDLDFITTEDRGFKLLRFYREGMEIEEIQDMFLKQKHFDMAFSILKKLYVPQHSSEEDMTRELLQLTLKCLDEDNNDDDC